ncbi:MAG: hypothetical protein AAGI38_18475 [Bacteroidota bacterium]
MKHYFKSALLLAVITLSVACSYNNREDIIQEEIDKDPAVALCDTLTVTYSGEVSDLMQTYGCVGCHQTGAARAGILLDSYDAVVDEITQREQRFFRAIKYENASMAKNMPPNGNQMDSCEVAQVQAWFNAGAAP